MLAFYHIEGRTKRIKINTASSTSSQFHSGFALRKTFVGVQKMLFETFCERQ